MNSNNSDEGRLRRIKRLNSKHGMKLLETLRPDVRQDEAAQYFRGRSMEMPPPMARDFADWVSKELGYEENGYEDREVYVTPYPGNYGLAGYIITVNGSPPRATVNVLLHSRRLQITVSGDRCLRGHGDSAGRTERRRYQEVLAFLMQLGCPLEPYAVVS